MKSFAEIKAEMETELSERNEKIREASRSEAAATEAAKAKRRSAINGICPKCHTYCYGDCQAN